MGISQKLPRKLQLTLGKLNFHLSADAPGAFVTTGRHVGHAHQSNAQARTRDGFGTPLVRFDF
jgi:hypothetical protein